MAPKRLCWLVVVLVAVGCGPRRLPPVEVGWVHAFHFVAANHMEADYYIDQSTFRMDKAHRAFWLRARGMMLNGDEMDSTNWWVVDCAAAQVGSWGGTWVTAGGMSGHVNGHQMMPVLPGSLSDYVFSSVCGAERS